MALGRAGPARFIDKKQRWRCRTGRVAPEGPCAAADVRSAETAAGAKSYRRPGHGPAVRWLRGSGGALKALDFYADAAAFWPKMRLDVWVVAAPVKRPSRRRSSRRWPRVRDLTGPI